MEQKYDETGDLEDYIVLDDDDDATTSHLDLSNLRKRKTKIISSAKETIEHGKIRKIKIPRESFTEVLNIRAMNFPLMFPFAQSF